MMMKGCFLADTVFSHYSLFKPLTQGKRKLVDGFVRWLSRGNVGLNQQASVTDVKEEDPTGLYDGFYVKTH
jgi:hypothetical protein